MLFVCRPSLARLAWSSGDFSPSLSAPLSLSITAAGVRTGASNPNHRYGGNPPNPLSPIVGTSGSSDHPPSLVTASARRRTYLMRGRRTALEVMPIWILAAQQIRNRGRGAFVWNENDIAGGSDPEQLEADMRTNADGGAGCELARIGLGVLHEFLQ